MKKKRLNPPVSITSHDVIVWVRRHFQDPTRAEASRWLIAHRRWLEDALPSVLAERMDEILNMAAVVVQPDPRVNERLMKLRNAIYAVAVDYGAAMQMDAHGEAVVEDDLLQIANILSRERPETFRACIDMEHHFGLPTDDHPHTKPIALTARVHIRVAGGRMKVELVRDRTCKHDGEFFVPDARRIPGRN